MQQPRSVIPGALFPALADPQGCATLALQFQLERTQWLPPAELSRLQLAQLKLVLDHAYGTVPYYRDLFDAQNLRVPDPLDHDFLARVPVSRRAAIRDAGDAICSSSVPERHGRAHPVVTSGSTGEPVRLLGNAMVSLHWHAFALRDHLWHERDFSDKLAIIRWAPRDRYQAPHGEHHPTWGSIVDPAFDSGPSCVLNVATPLEEQVAWLLRERPLRLLSYPSNLDALARYWMEHGIEPLRLNEVRTVGESLNAVQRALYRSVWSCGVVDMYTCEEAGYLALQCPAHDHYHVQSENVLLEIVDDEGRPCPAGRAGRVLITTLHNFATPLIRYELGDYAEFGAPCPCGRGLPVIGRIHGRRRNRIVYPDGRSEFPYLGEHGQIHRLTGVRVRGFQIVQRSVEEVEIRLVAERKLDSTETSAVARQFQTNFGHPFRITVTYWDEIPKGSRGKFEEFVSEVG